MPLALMKHHQPISSSAHGMRIAVVVSRYHTDITNAMCDGAKAAFLSAGGSGDCIEVIDAPGSFELIALCRAAADRGDVDGVVALGCILTGDTTHDQYIAHAVAGGISSIIVQTGVPVAFGVLTCQSMEQARSRAGGRHGNKGEESMSAIIATVTAVRQIGCSKEAGC